MKTNPFTEKKSGKKPEAISKVDPDADPLVERVLEEYTNFDFMKWVAKEKDHIFGLKLDILNPLQINLALQRMIAYGNEESEGKGYGHITGLFVSKLIQDSYNNGCNDFTLTTGDSGVYHLCSHLKGEEDNILNVQVNGNVGKVCGESSQHILLSLFGNAGSFCGSRSKYSTFKLQNDVGQWCAFESQHSDFLVYGNAGDDCASSARYTNLTVGKNVGNSNAYSSHHCSFLVEGNAGDGFGSHSYSNSFIVGGNVGDGCGEYSHQNTFTFKRGVGSGCGHESQENLFIASDPETYRRLKVMIPEGNEVSLLNEGEQ